MPTQTLQAVRVTLVRLLRIQILTGVVVVCLVIASGWWNQHSSCLRSNEIRKVALKRAAADMDRARILRAKGDYALARNAMKTSRASSSLSLLSCDRPFPEE